MNKEQLKKLPAWAQAHIAKIEMERDQAIKTMNQALDEAVLSPIYYEKIVCTGESASGGPSQKRVYVQSRTIVVSAFGIELSVRLKDREKRIQVAWSDPEKMSTDIAMVPTLQQTVELVAKENMRDYRNG